MDGFAELHHTMELVAREMDGAAARARLERVGKASTGDVEVAVRGDLGDLSMSGWRDKSGTPIDLGGRAKVISDSAVEMLPAAIGGINWAKGLGPMRVLQDGRQSYAAGDRRRSGSRLNKAGERVAKTRKVKRTTGGQEGKGTWSDATEIMAREMPARYEAELAAGLAKHLRRG